MRRKPYISARGVYYDLTKSPYKYTDYFGNVYKFSSLKKQSMFETKVLMLEESYRIEAKRLEQLNYNLDESYFNNMKHIPARVYEKMNYK